MAPFYFLPVTFNRLKMVNINIDLCLPRDYSRMGIQEVMK